MLPIITSFVGLNKGLDDVLRVGNKPVNSYWHRCHHYSLSKCKMRLSLGHKVPFEKLIERKLRSHARDLPKNHSCISPHESHISVLLDYLSHALLRRWQNVTLILLHTAFYKLSWSRKEWYYESCDCSILGTIPEGQFLLIFASFIGFVGSEKYRIDDRKTY